MPSKSKKPSKPKGIRKVTHHAKRVVVGAHRRVKPHAVRAKSWWQRRPLHQKIITWIIVFLLAIVGFMYGIARWYIAKHAHEPMQVGITFIPTYARHFELDPQETMQAMIDELGMRRFRLVSYWEVHEPTKGQYDFSELDWQFKKAEESGSKVSLAIGLRQPRWPECHMPQWALQEPKEVWYPQLKDYMKEVINRYKDSPVLQDYQLENEYFLEVFGECTDFDRDRLVDEFNFVKQLDPNHPVIITRSNNAVGFPIGKPRPDKFGVSVYKRVWDKSITKRYIEYPFPAWFYAFLAGGGEILTGKDMIIHELQAEAWLPDGFTIKDAPVSETNKSMNPDRLKDRFEYGRATGMRTIDLWGAEWWYYRKVKFNDTGLWDVAAEEVKRLTTSDKQCDNDAKTRVDGHSYAPC
jgi:hypothetical protein